LAEIYARTDTGDVPATDDDAAVLALDPAFVLPRRVAWWAERAPERPFLQEVTGRSLTYGETWEAARRWATWLAEQGVGPGDRFVTMLPAAADAVLLFLAGSLLGAVEVPVNPDLRGSFLHHVLTDADARLAVVRAEFAASVHDSGVDLAVVVVEREDVRPMSCAVAPVSFSASSDAACVIYTSGTTGPAKGVVLSWAQLAATIGRIPRSWFDERDAVYCCHPMFHVTGRSPLVTMADVGGRVVLRERFSASSFLADVREHGCTSSTVQVGLVLATPESPDDADNPLRVVYGGHNLTLAHRFGRRFGVHVVDAYGSTEAGFPLLLRWLPADLDRRWCGRLRRGYQARVVDAAGHDVADGTAGELWIRPPARALVMLEYLNRPDATTSAFAGEWYRTGDAVVRGADGEFEFVDRLRDTIRRLGENISTSAVETVVAAEPDVAECAVIGVPDPVAGHEVLLAVVPRDGHELDAAGLYTRLTARLPRYMLPAYVVVCAELPKTPTHKVQKAGLLDALDLDRAWRPPARRHHLQQRS
jgi:crotonobetaine/carnitine-CoA ligase